ncbi:MAG: hypothetical protein P8Y02_15415 [Deinococcales bacterium]|jgi:hypothetical protein
MDERTERLGLGAGIGFAIGVGICFMATLGVWLQYSTHVFTAWSGGALSLAVGIVVGGGWYLLRRGRS